MKIDLLKAFQNKINIQFGNTKILQEALTHRSCEETVNNERLEFLGDSVLGIIITENIFKKFPKEPEGFLAKCRAYLVRADKLKEKADSIDLGKYVRIGKGEEKSGGRKRASILANAMEAVIGAIFLDKGLDITKKFVLELYKSDLKKENIRLNEYFDYKTILQEFVQKVFKETPVYKIVNERGPDHKKIFDVEVVVDNEKCGFGSGHSKKEAEQVAAKQAYIKLKRKQEG